MDYEYGKIAGFSSLIACVLVILSFFVSISMFDGPGMELISGILFGISSILAFTRRQYYSSYGSRYGSVCFNFLGIIIIIGDYYLRSIHSDILEVYGIEFIYVLLLNAIGIIFAVIGIITYVIYYFNEAPL